jgi:hypothetical protein
MATKKPSASSSPWRGARELALRALHSSLLAEGRALTDDEAALVARCLFPSDAGHDDVIAAVATASAAMQRSPSANLILTSALDGWGTAMRGGASPRANEPQLAAQIESLGVAGLRKRDDREAVRAGADALRSLVACVEVAAEIVALPAFAPHVARLEPRFNSLPTFARVRCAEALTRHRGHPDALAIFTRARERLVAHAGDNPARRERVAPFVAQFDDWISATRAP